MLPSTATILKKMTDKPTPDKAPPPEFDSPWKDVLTRFFPAFMQMFYEDISDAIDWPRGFEFLDNELQKIAVKGKLGKRLADKLVKVWLLDGQEVWVLIHVEIQGRRERGFARRMFVYHYRIFDSYGQRVISLAVLTDEDSRWRPSKFSYNLFGTGIELNFRAVKLLDYAAHWTALEANPNPFALVVMAHLKSLQTRQQVQQRYNWKWNIARALLQRGYDAEAVRQLFRFIDWVLTLPEELERKLDHELIVYRKEHKMEYISGFERRAMERSMQEGLQKGLQKGLQQGVQQGRQEQGAAMALRLLHRRVGEIKPTIAKRIASLPLAQIEALTDALLDFSTVGDLNKWLREQGQVRRKTTTPKAKRQTTK